METVRAHLLIASLLAAVTLPAFGQGLKVETIANPSGPTSLQAHWSTTQDGSPLISWVEIQKDGKHVLRYAVRRGTEWSAPRSIVAGRHFFRQPAESPSVISFKDGSLLAEWVEVPEESSEAEYLYVSASKDGVQWTQPVMAHHDHSPVQHALASMAVSGDREASLIWLEALKGEDAPSALKRTIVSSDGKVMKEETLDSDVCTCCPTTIVRTARGLLVAYRDHTPGDIRDIGVIRFANGRWLPSRILNPDKWEINACPVNGASAAAQDSRVAIGWYTEAQDTPKTQLVFSNDAGATFSKPIRISAGNSFGHVSVALDEAGGAFVSWLEESADGAATRLLLRHVTSAGVAGPVTQVSQGSRQSLGYPRLGRVGKEVWIAWGNSGTATIHTARVTQ